MKKLLMCLFVFAFSLPQALCQEVPEPDFAQKPFFLTGGKLADFEKADASMERKLKGMGYGGVEFYYSVEGGKSSVRFPQNALPRIILKSEDNSDPSETFTLCMAEVKKSGRRFKAMKMGALGGLKNSTDNRIKLTAKKIRDKVFELVLEQPLAPGEYALIPYSADATAKATTTGVKVSCFGID